MRPSARYEGRNGWRFAPIGATEMTRGAHLPPHNSKPVCSCKAEAAVWRILPAVRIAAERTIVPLTVFESATVTSTGRFA